MVKPDSELTCPECGQQERLVMPTDACPPIQADGDCC